MSEKNDAAVCRFRPGDKVMCGPVELVMLVQCPPNWGDQKESGPVWLVYEKGEEMNGIRSYYVRNFKPTGRRVAFRTLDRHLRNAYELYPELRPLTRTLNALLGDQP